MAVAIPIVDCTISGATQFGNTSRNMIRRSLAPNARAAVTYSRSRMDRTDARTSRAYCGITTIPTASIALVRLGPMIATTTMASRILGKANMTSIKRITSISTAPPQYPAANPRHVPHTNAMPTATRPIRSEIRAPCITRLNTSRPKSSVPNGSFSEGGLSRRYRSVRNGSDGRKTGASMPTSAKARRMPPPTVASRFRISRRAASTSGLCERSSIYPSIYDLRLPGSANQTSPVLDPRIQPRVQHICSKIDQHEARRDQQHSALHCSEISGQHR